MTRLAPHLAAQICDDYVVMLRLLCEASSTTTIGALLDSHGCRGKPDVELARAAFDPSQFNRYLVGCGKHSYNVCCRTL